MTKIEKIREMKKELRQLQAMQERSKSHGDWTAWMTLESKASALADKILAIEAEPQWAAERVP